MTTPVGVHGPWMLGREVRWRFILMLVRNPFSVRRKSRCQATSDASRFFRSTLLEWPFTAQEGASTGRASALEGKHPKWVRPSQRTILSQRVRVLPWPHSRFQRQVGVLRTQRLHVLRDEGAERGRG